jgi:hypothetical protein
MFKLLRGETHKQKLENASDVIVPSFSPVTARKNVTSGMCFLNHNMYTNDTHLFIVGLTQNRSAEV